MKNNIQREKKGVTSQAKGRGDKRGKGVSSAYIPPMVTSFSGLSCSLEVVDSLDGAVIRMPFICSLETDVSLKLVLARSPSPS